MIWVDKEGNMVYILLVSNVHNEIKLISDYCKENNYIFFFLDDPSKTFEFLLNENITVCIINENIINNAGEFVSSLREEGCNTSFIYIGEPSFQKVRSLLKLGFYDFLPYEYENNELKSIVNEALENVEAFEKIKGLSEDLEATNKKLLDRTRELEDEKKELKRYINILTETSDYIKEVNSKRDIGEIVKTSLNYLKKYFEDRIILFTFIENYREYVVGSVNISYKAVKNYTWDLKDLKHNPWATAITNEKKRLFVPNPVEDIYYSQSSITNIFSGGFLKIPLVARDKVYGTITVSCVKNNLPKEDDLFLNIFSEHTAIAIDNATLNERLQDTIVKLEKAQEQAVESEKLKTLANLAVSINHRINNPLCAISLNVEFLKRYIKNDEKLGNVIESIERNIDNITQITSKISQMKTISVKEYLPGIEMIDLDD